MKRHLGTILTMLTVSMLAATVVLAAGPSDLVMDTYHQDHRVTPKLQFEPKWDGPAGLQSSAVAPLYIEMMGSEYGLPTNPADLEMVQMRESLLGYHYTYQQKIAGIPVDRAEFIVSVAKKDSRVYQVFNNIYPVKTAPARSLATLDLDRAYDIAWNHLRAQSDLGGQPKSRLVYTPEGDGFRLNYVLDMVLAAPDGAWSVRVDATTGAVVSVEDTRMIRKITSETLTADERLAAVSGPATDRAAAFDRQMAKDNAEAQIIASGSRATGSGVVFDPDPRTTLNDNSLTDNSPASYFTPAPIYLTS